MRHPGQELTLNPLVPQSKAINNKQQWSNWYLDFKNHSILTLKRITPIETRINYFYDKLCN